MSERLPLLVFPGKRTFTPDPGHPFPRSKPHLPEHARQVTRISEQFNELNQFFEKYNASLAGAVAGLEPETVLVMEIAGSVDEFKQAIEAAEMEWLGESGPPHAPLITHLPHPTKKH